MPAAPPPRVDVAEWAAVAAPWAALVRASLPPAAPFVTPQFLGAWVEAFDAADRVRLRTVREGETLVGVLPLQRLDADRVGFLGDPNVFDYMDLVAAPGAEAAVIAALLDTLDADGVRHADLWGLAAGSFTLARLPEAARARGWQVAAETEAVCPIVPLAPTWETYLAGLKGKQRREVRRKLRNLLEFGARVDYEVVDDPAAIRAHLPAFLRLMTDSRGDKAAFLTEQMAAFFHLLVSRLAPEGWVRFVFLLLNGERVAAVLAFPRGDSLLLYNSGYDPAYRDRSVGLASKVICVRDAIDRGMASVNFLRGDEDYKMQLGGRAEPVTRLRLQRAP